MIAGELYRPEDPELTELRRRARRLIRRLNEAEDDGERVVLLRRLLGAAGDRVWIEPPFYCDYGFNIRAGDGFYMNFDCVILDVAPVTIGDNVMCGPKVQIYTATHPLVASERVAGAEFARPVRIGNNVWIGGGAIICPGVTVGDNTTIAAGSVVTRDLPPGVLAGGNPCRVIREIGG